MQQKYRVTETVAIRNHSVFAKLLFGVIRISRRIHPLPTIWNCPTVHQPAEVSVGRRRDSLGPDRFRTQTHIGRWLRCGECAGGIILNERAATDARCVWSSAYSLVFSVFASGIGRRQNPRRAKKQRTVTVRKLCTTTTRNKKTPVGYQLIQGTDDPVVLGQDRNISYRAETSGFRSGS
jgi:hypothetical protein